MTVGALVLAAGKARRFGSDKRTARLLDGQRSIDALLDQLDASGLPTVVCVGPGDKEICAILDHRGYAWQICEHSIEGMGGTLAEGIVFADSWEGVLIVLADMPWIEAGTYTAIADRIDTRSICVPTFAGRRGHPVGFGKSYYEQISALNGDIGARSLLEQHRDSVLEVAVDDPGILQDIDRPGDIAAQSSV